METLSQDILSAISGFPSGVMTEAICSALGRTAQELGDSLADLKERGQVIGFAGLWFLPSDFRDAREAFLSALRSAQEAKPEVAFWDAAIVARDAGLGWSGKPLERILGHLGPAVRLSSKGVRLRSVSLALTPRQAELLDRVLKIDPGKWGLLPSKELSNLLEMPVQAVDEILRLGDLAGRVAEVGLGTYFPMDRLKELEELVGRGVSAGELRQQFGAPRRVAGLLMDYLKS
jgi:hypothetical protein